MLQSLAEKGSADDFYRGEIGRRIAAAFQKNGGLVTAEDMANYRPLELAPLQVDWRDYKIATAPLTAGGLTILQTIATIKATRTRFGTPAKGQPDTHARASRSNAHCLGRPSTAVWRPAARRCSRRAIVVRIIGARICRKGPRGNCGKAAGAVATDGHTAGGTVNLSAADGNGMMACVTLTHGDSFGAEVTVDGLGLLLGHGMSRFDPIPGRPNSIAPGKRPLDNMSPTIVLHNSMPMLAIGAAGGRRIVNGVFEVLFNRIIDGHDLEDAIAEPRLHTEGGTALHAERGRPESEIQYLTQIGYSIFGPQQCYVSAVEIDRAKRGGYAVGVADSPPTQAREARDRHPTIIHAG